MSAVAPRKYDPGYSFQSSEVLSQRDREGGESCSLGSWCHAATRSDDGEWHPARTFQPFCPACRSAIAGRLEELPEACVRMLVQIGQRPKTGKAVRVPPGPREPIRLEIDALVREMAFVLGSWHERVAAIDNLTAPDMHAAVRHPAKAVGDAVKILHPRIDALLALQPEPMVRMFYLPKAAEEQADGVREGRPWTGGDGRVLPSGEAYLLPELGGREAGKEILDLHHRARKITGQVRARPESFDGIPCRSSEAMCLERAEPPSNPQQRAMKSRCADCGDVMDDETFDAWVRHYHGWANAASAGLTCRRCARGEHSICQWNACGCRASGHAADTAA